MPTVQLLSDIHLEFHSDNGRAYLESLDKNGVDILVLAGDICSYELLPEVFSFFAAHYPDVIYVSGNHELYGSSFAAFRQQAQTLPRNVHFLENRSVDVQGLHFVGTTLWFSRWKEMEQYKNRLNDFRHIQNFEEQVFVENQKAKEFLADVSELAESEVANEDWN